MKLIQQIEWFDASKELPKKTGEYLAFYEKIKDGKIVREVNFLVFYKEDKRFWKNDVVVVFWAEPIKNPLEDSNAQIIR